jgi:hypothetical protein
MEEQRLIKQVQIPVSCIPKHLEGDKTSIITPSSMIMMSHLQLKQRLKLKKYYQLVGVVQTEGVQLLVNHGS